MPEAYASRQPVRKNSPTPLGSRCATAGADAGEVMAAIVAKRLVEHLECSGFVVMKKPPIGGGAAIGRGADGR